MDKTSLFLTGLHLDKKLSQSIPNLVANDPHFRAAFKFADTKNTERYNIGFATLFGKIVKADFLDTLYKGLIDVIDDKADVSVGLGIDAIKSMGHFDKWGVFVTGQSDPQAAFSMKDLYQNPKSAFCGIPYYKTKYIDSIEVNFHGFKCKDLSQQIIEEIKRDILLSFFGLDIIEKRRTKNTSNDVVSEERYKAIPENKSLFGISLFSNILFSAFSSNDQIQTTFTASNFLNNPSDTSCNSLSEDGAFLWELVRLCANPSTLTFLESKRPSTAKRIEIVKINSPATDRNGDIELSDLVNIVKYESAVGNQTEYLSVTIPVKKFVALPSSTLQTIITLGRIPKPDEKLSPVPGVFSDDELEVISLGGAEHNLGLVHLINHHRYESNYEVKTEDHKYIVKNKRRFGFLENYFDYYYAMFENGTMEFLFGSEKLVSGLNKYYFSRQGISTETGFAKILPFTVYGNINVTCVYGMSAPMTKIALFLMSMARSKYNLEHIDYTAIEELKTIPTTITMMVGGDTTYMNILDEWDNLDILNNWKAGCGDEINKFICKLIANTKIRYTN